MTTKEQFLSACGNHPASKFVTGVFDFFHLKKKFISPVLASSFAVCFIFSFISLLLAKVFAIVLALIIIPSVILNLIAHIMNQSRILKICTELKITPDEYQDLANEYL